MKKTIKCKHCKGTGKEPHSHTKDYNGLTCIECEGAGEIYND